MRVNTEQHYMILFKASQNILCQQAPSGYIRLHQDAMSISLCWEKVKTKKLGKNGGNFVVKQRCAVIVKLIPIIKPGCFILCPNSTQVNLFLVNFYGSLPFHIFEINPPHNAWLLIHILLSSMSFSALDFLA